MDVSDLLDSLNDVQREAVAAAPGNMLIVAGAGSGKTRVLAHRIAYLVRTQQASPNGILAVTFTNKAAREMRGRIEQLLDMPVHGMWIGTFHGIAHRLLRAHWQELGIPQAFQIIDSDDQYRVIRRVLKQLDLDESRWPPKQVQWFINGNKDEGLRSSQMDANGDVHQQQLIKIYAAYEEVCDRSGLIDFAELLLRAHELWLKHPAVLQHYQQRFPFILVDEFQDTNAIQYAWLRMLASDRNHMFAVGDDDQSIYGWRGARIENIQRFSEDLPNTLILRLEQNYRSTCTILNAANELIANNDGRLGKNLWTSGEQGELIKLYAAFNDQEEARYIVENINEAIQTGMTRSEIAILYRSNAQSRVLEEALLRAGIPYRIYGGMRFFERAEIKDALAYLRLINSRDNDAAFERVVNTPTRGIGDRSVQAVRDYARTHKVSLWQAARAVVENKLLAMRSVKAIDAFCQLIENMAERTQDMSLDEMVDDALQQSTLYAHHRNDKTEKGRMRLENLEELVSAARQFTYEDEETDMDDLSAFLAHAALESGEEQANEWEDSIQMMTLHTAKGLEFNRVYLTGLEEGLFPHQRSIEEPGRLEEERRLCYVGMTRAKRELIISYAEIRRLHGMENYTQASRFIQEIPDECIDSVRMGGAMSRAQPGHAQSQVFADDSGIEFQLGQRVNHAKFGDGVIMNCEGHGAHARVQVNFERAGSKWLVAAYANLQRT